MISKIGILGTGVIGTIYGWALSEKFDVRHIISKKHRNNIGILDIDVIDERRPDDDQNVVCKYNPKLAFPSDVDFDLVIVPVSEDRLEQALIDISDIGSPLLIMASNWDGVDMIERHVPNGSYVLGYAGGGGTFIEEDFQTKLWGNIGTDVVVGAVSDSQRALAGDVAEMFSKIGITAEDHGNVLHWLWMHNVDSAIIGAALSAHKDIESFVDDEALIRLCFDAMAEGFKVCASRGVDTGSFPESGMYSMPFEQLYPMFRDNMLSNPVMKRFTAHAFEAIPEMKINFRKIHECGKRNGIDTPNMDVIASVI